MKKEKKISGSSHEFDLNWRIRQEAHYNHWTPGKPNNQVQLAFRSHWEVFRELIGPLAQRRGKSLEVGCGRGSLSSYFAADGWDVTLLDCSQSVVDTARKVFAKNGHNAEFVTGDANKLPFSDDSFDVTFSIGLLEHFEDVYQPISESFRVLRPGGWFLGYIVPERPDNIQRYFNWINFVLAFFSRVFQGMKKEKFPKAPIYRSDFGSQHYLKAMEGLAYSDLIVLGMYPLPMISHSPEFPFSLLPKPLEWVLARIFEIVLLLRRLITGNHGWICSEDTGQAFLLAFRKPVE